ncbi:basic salivary proline-rich protein 4-like [Canis lupus familiaris]|uniref:basic salivary proline-rich protein 4-like n=1 Tax=Canis lupus familiaris TaxID=9615 RepID=UPI0018F345DE|nr:basic salivary proline-rich protein 4-like [Canis lupus familiaris]XP_038311270.1 basic salivary proline-rich protein 4-like [Canis lupus familiaris]XP_038421318.1 basic salivary proline-rich protein 4-like [Canis lupus familiaris]
MEVNRTPDRASHSRGAQEKAAGKQVPALSVQGREEGETEARRPPRGAAHQPARPRPAPAPTVCGGQRPGRVRLFSALVPSSPSPVPRRTSPTTGEEVRETDREKLGRASAAALPIAAPAGPRRPWRGRPAGPRRPGPGARAAPRPAAGARPREGRRPARVPARSPPAPPPPPPAPPRPTPAPVLAVRTALPAPAAILPRPGRRGHSPRPPAPAPAQRLGACLSGGPHPPSTPGGPLPPRPGELWGQISWQAGTAPRSGAESYCRAVTPPPPPERGSDEGRAREAESRRRGPRRRAAEEPSPNSGPRPLAPRPGPAPARPREVAGGSDYKSQGASRRRPAAVRGPGGDWPPAAGGGAGPGSLPPPGPSEGASPAAAAATAAAGAGPPRRCPGKEAWEPGRGLSRAPGPVHPQAQAFAGSGRLCPRWLAAGELGGPQRETAVQPGWGTHCLREQGRLERASGIPCQPPPNNTARA